MSSKTHNLAVACGLYWRLRGRDPEGAAMASMWRRDELNRARLAGVRESVLEKIDDEAKGREEGA